MNKSRRMLALQARRLSEKGTLVLLPDLYGTGDSAGDFSDASVTIWLEDARLMFEYLIERGMRTVNLLCVRMGSLLCGPVASLIPESLSLARIVFWQPYTTGEALVREFLRIRVAADMAAGKTSSNESLLQEARSTGSVEVAGYTLSDRAIQELARLDLGTAALPPDLPVAWLEMSLSETPKLRRGSHRLVSEWREQGRTVAARAETCPPFWSATEIVESAGVLDSTSSLLIDGIEHGWS